MGATVCVDIGEWAADSGRGASGCLEGHRAARRHGGCARLVPCTSTPGGRTCGACHAGHTETGETGGRDVDECASNNGACDPLTTCTNLPGGRSCGACP